MFNALNRFISRLDSDGPTQQSNHGHFGFQVLRNKSPELSVEPWFDFIVGINGRTIDDSDPMLFSQEVRNCAGSTVTLYIWSAKGQRTRSLHIPVPADQPTLGLALQWTSLSAASNIWHILDVPANSPADLAGLLPYSDYILGTPEGVLHGETGLGELVEDHIGRPLRLYVYNNEYDVTRDVTIQPSRDWGGEGALGCVLGYGALHRLPAPLSGPLAGPGETLFDTENARFSNEEIRPLSGVADSQFFVPASEAAEPGDFLVPAQMAGPPIGSTPGKKKGARHANRSPNRVLDDYFTEGEKKSRELDHAPGAKSTPPPPPPRSGEGPPKAGGPPPGGPPKSETPRPVTADAESVAETRVSVDGSVD
ncbi:GRASP55/65 PDZ-like domain-containing protein [Amylocarpus encephaloides]|uniref:GRASP55/65 PDZ-like domain-containing protein n=1 Tax=Amylocarpus encephaloides TaxID=45428 RepID=A0A9P7YGU0_9HELO|nr:GRASP55/65 PDZ-like domain-containing protein [Amylocarpus encephaloides]